MVDLVNRWDVILVDTTAQTAYGWSLAYCEVVTDAIEEFLNARTAYETNDSTANRIKKDEAKVDCIAAMRTFANKNVRFNEKVPTDIKERLGVTVQDNDHARVKVVEAGPASVVLSDNRRPGVVVIRYLGPRPEGSISCNINFGRFKPGDTLPRTINALTQADSFTHNPWEYTFPQDASGDKFFYALRWVMSGGAKSAWSAIAECVIP